VGNFIFPRRPWSFWNFQTDPQTPSPPSSSSGASLHLCCPLPPVQSTSPSLLHRPPPIHLLLPPSPRVVQNLPAALALPRCPVLRAPRPPQAPAGCHLAAAVIRACACLISLSLLLSNIGNSCSLQLHS
jgi:hypothetical protein